MRAFPLIALALLAACAPEGQDPVIQIDVHVPPTEPPTIIVETPESEEVVEIPPTDSEELACEPTDVLVMSRDTPNGWAIESVSDDLVATNVWHSSWVPNTAAFVMPIYLETLLDCASVEVYGLTFYVQVIGSESEARSVENFDATDSLVITRQIGEHSPWIGEARHYNYYTSVENISGQFGGEDTWQGYASVSLTGSQPDVAMPFEPFLVQPGEQERIDVTFNGVDKLPLGTTIEVGVSVFYRVDGHTPEPKEFTIPVVVYVPQP